MPVGWSSERGWYPCSCLLQISLRQGLQADPGALAALCEKTDNDIRACINTLQVGGEEAGCGGWHRGQPPLNPCTLCPVPARARPAGAECPGRADHTSRPQGPAQGALLRVAGGLPAAPGPEVGGWQREGGPGSAWTSVVPQPRTETLCVQPAPPFANRNQGCLGPAFKAVPQPPSPPPPWGSLEAGGCCHQE